MQRAFFHRLAKLDFRTAREWYAKESPNAMHRFIAAVDAAVNEAMRKFDTLERLTARDRRLRIEKFPFCLIVRLVDSETILILAVAHHKRRRRYWNRR